MSWQAIIEAGEAIRGTALAGEASLADLPLAGIGWGTVEAERAQRELDELLGTGDAAEPAAATAWLEQSRDAGLGARAWLRQAPPPATTGPWLVLLEPDTEGRLAASLARHGEGVLAIYLGSGSYRAGSPRPGGPVSGPHVVVLGGERPATGESLA